MPVVPPVVTERVLGKAVEPHQDGRRYTRESTNVEAKTGLLVGRRRVLHGARHREQGRQVDHAVDALPGRGIMRTPRSCWGPPRPESRRR